MNKIEICREVTIKNSFRKEVFEAIEKQDRLADYMEEFIGQARKTIEEMGPPPPGYRYEVCELRFDFNPEEGKYTITSYIKKVPIE